MWNAPKIMQDNHLRAVVRGETVFANPCNLGLGKARTAGPNASCDKQTYDKWKRYKWRFLSSLKPPECGGIARSGIRIVESLIKESHEIRNYFIVNNLSEMGRQNQT